MATEPTVSTPAAARPRRRAMAWVVAAALSTALTAALAGCGGSSSSSATASGKHDSSMGDMSGMNHAGTSPAGTTPSADHSAAAHAATGPGDMNMPGMAPLVSGADGTSASAGGLTLLAGGIRFKAGTPGTLRLIVTKTTGQRVKSFEPDQTKLMHLIVVRNDFTGYQHLHPKFHRSSGQFTVSATLPKAGVYRAIADFTTDGKRYALGVNLTALGGAAKKVALPSVSKTASVDRYDVKLTHGPLRAGKETKLRFTVTSGGQPETALQPYLGAEGHLVALRDPDLAYSHVHPISSDLADGSITFNADFPSAAKYRLYLQFRAGSAVHTAEFTLDVS